MHEIEMLVLIMMRMGILFRNPSMCSPARMCDSEGIGFFFFDFFRYFGGETRYFPDGSDEFEFSSTISN
jgi:hypothetical protein